VLHINDAVDIGGAQKIVYQICKATRNHLGKVVVASRGGDYEKSLTDIDVIHEKIPDIQSKKPVEMLWIFRKLRDIVRKYNINYIHCHHRMAVFYAKFLLPKSQIIYNNHTIYSDKRMFSHLVLNGVNIIADGAKARDNVVDFFKIKKDIAVIYNAVDDFDGIVNIIPEIEERRERGDFIVMNSSRLHPQKGMDYFIKAAKILIDKGDAISFFIVGDGGLRMELESLVNEMGISDSVHFLGYRTDIKSTIKQCDVLVLTSVYEGLPLTPMEAFSVKKAVVATDIDGTNEVVIDGVNGLLAKTRNEFSIAEKIEELYFDRDKLQKLSNNAYVSYQKKFSEEKFDEQYLEFYSGLCFREKA
jgi:glycosyltransferase involved in cell wall biosynthesis